MTELKGEVKNVTTKSKFDKISEEVVHLTSVKVEFRDLDHDTIEALALGEYNLSLLTMDLIPRILPPQ